MTDIGKAFGDDAAARQYLDSAWRGPPLPGDLLPPHKWVQALFLCDGGRVRVRSVHLAHLLDVPIAVADAVACRLRP